MLIADEIKRGEKGLFEGFTASKQLLYMIVPILLILHVIAVAVNFKPCGNWQAYATYAQPPLSPHAEDSVLLVMSKVCVRA